jgi:hypothetical protein
MTAGALAPDIALSTGVKTAEIFTLPRNDGFHEQDVVKLEPDPVANLFLHPAMTTPEDLKVILELKPFLFFNFKSTGSSEK